MPPDFPDMFVRLGWEAIEDHYQTGQECIRRWMGECGELDLVERRRGYMRKVYASRGIASIIGRKPKGVSEMRESDPALAFMPVRRLRRPYHGQV